MTDATRELIQRMAEELDHYRQLLMDDRRETHALANEARAYLSQPEPKRPTEEEILELSGEHFDYRGDSMGGWFIPISIGPTIELSNQVHAFARAILARWGCPSIKPVPTTTTETP